MRKNIFYRITILLLSLELISCKGQLSKEQAKKILIKAYKNNDHPEADGGRQTTIKYLIIDSIHQQSDTALVFYRINGIIENGSQYPKSFDNGEKVAHLEWSISGWQSE